MADLPERPLNNEASAWTLLIDQIGLSTAEVRPFEAMEVFQ